MHQACKRRLLGGFLGIGGALLLSSFLWGQVTAPASGKAIALVGGKILTQTEAGTIDGTILIRDGKIVAVGPSVTIPSDATRIEIPGCTVTPGLIDARSTLWLSPAAIRESASDAGLDVRDGIDPHEEDWREVSRQGVTAVYVQPGNSGILGGRGAVLRVAPAETVDELVIKAEAGAQAALGVVSAAPAQPAQQNFGGRRGGNPQPGPQPEQPSSTPAAGNVLTRLGQYEQLKRALEAAKQYDDESKKSDASDAAKKAPSATKGGEGRRGPGARGNASARAKRDPVKEFMRKVMRGEAALRLEVHREDDIRNAVKLAEEFKIRIVLEGVNNPHAVAERIAALRLPLVLGPFVDLEDAPAYQKERQADWPRSILTPESKWALGTFSAHGRGSRLLRVHAAAAVAQGIEPERVLRAITRDAADIMGVADRLGTIATGKQADLAIFAGDPLDPAVPARLVMSAGKIVYQADSPLARSSSPNAPAKTNLETLPKRLPAKYALKTQHLLQDDGKAFAGLVLVENGKIAACGATVSVPNGTPIYDLGDAFLSPGFVAAHSNLGLTTSIDDPAEANAAQIRAADVYDPRHRPIRELLEGGFTSAYYTPGAANVVGGTCASVRLGAVGSIKEIGMKFSLTASSRGASRPAADSMDDQIAQALGRGARGPARYPGSLAGQVELITQVLSGKSPSSELYAPPLVRQQLQAERRRQIGALMERRQVAFFEAHTRAEVDAALRLVNQFNLRGVLVSPEDFRPFLDEMKRLNVGIVARPVHTGDYDKAAQQLADASAAGIPVTFGSATALEMRITASLAMNAGLSREAAFRGLTTLPSQVAGLPASTGQLGVGLPADLVIWDGLPLDLRSRPLRIVADGKVVQRSHEGS